MGKGHMERTIINVLEVAQKIKVVLMSKDSVEPKESSHTRSQKEAQGPHD